MRVNLITQPFGQQTSSKGKFSVSLTIRPACGLPGEYQFPTDSESLMRLLRRETSLPATVLERFEGKMCTPIGARLLGVELSESVLTRIGYFID
jgi:hypothetical protein